MWFDWNSDDLSLVSKGICQHKLRLQTHVMSEAGFCLGFFTMQKPKPLIPLAAKENYASRKAAASKKEYPIV